MLDLQQHAPDNVCWKNSLITPELADKLAPRLAELDAWKNISCSSLQLRAMLLTIKNGQFCQVILNTECQPMAAFIVWPDWFVGPYLQLLAVLPEYQRKARNIWVATSTRNESAQKMYRRCGFSAAATIAGLVSDHETEILYRKRLT